MANIDTATTTPRAAKVMGQRLLVDTGKMSVRRITKRFSSDRVESSLARTRDVPRNVGVVNVEGTGDEA